MAEKVIIERAHRTPAFRNPNRKYPRPIHVAFLLWEQANEIAMSTQRVLKEKPYAHKGEELKLFVNQMYSPRVTQLRKQALKIRWELKQEHKGWIIYLQQRSSSRSMKMTSQLSINGRRTFRNITHIICSVRVCIRAVLF